MTSDGKPKVPGADTLSKEHVDLGEDLLESTAELGELSAGEGLSRDGDPAVDPFADPARYRADKIVDIADVLKNADILISEGLLEDAKRVLHSALRKSPHHIPAREKLKALHELELKYIFTGQSGVKTPDRKSQVALPTRAESESILQRLDTDFKLGIYGDPRAAKDDVTGLSLFATVEDIEAYAANLERQLSGIGIRGRMDLGIAFLEMGLPLVAARQFRSALSAAESTNDAEMRLGAASLLAYALITANKAFDAVICLEPFVSDSEIPPGDRIHFLYLMGVAHEAVGKKEAAGKWFSRVRDVDPYYRDVAERLREK
jgi:hypothetical protein